MKTIQIIKNYTDIELGKLVEIDTVRKVSDKRAQELVAATVAIIIQDPDETLEYDTTPPLKTPKQIDKVVKQSKKKTKK